MPKKKKDKAYKLFSKKTNAKSTFLKFLKDALEGN